MSAVGVVGAVNPVGGRIGATILCLSGVAGWSGGAIWCWECCKLDLTGYCSSVYLGCPSGLEFGGSGLWFGC